MNESPQPISVGWIGTGVMGASMARHLLDAGYPMTVFSRTRRRAEPLLEAGAAWAESPRCVAERSEITFSIVGYPSDVREVHLGADGTLAGAKPDSLIVDMTTSEPTLAMEIARAAAEKKVGAVDAPVSGGDVGARNATLSIMVGGPKEAVQRAWPLLDVMGKTIVHQGPAGAGQHAKMVNQTLIATGMIGVCEALLYAHAAGLDLETVLQSVRSGAAGSWSLSNLAPRIIDGDFEPGFFVEHFIKDMGIALAEARKMKLCLPGLALAQQLYQAVEAQGGGHKGTQALQLALAQLSGREWPSRSKVPVPV